MRNPSFPATPSPMSRGDFSAIDALVAGAVNRVFPAAQIHLRLGGTVVYDACFGYLDPETRTQPVNPDTRFDLASVSKLFTVVAFMTLVEAGRVRLDQPIADVLPEFTGPRPIAPYPDPLRPGGMVEIVPPTPAQVNADAITFRQVLSHSAGLPAWLPLWRMALDQPRDLPAHEVQSHLRSAVLTTAFAYPPGTRVIYSDVGLLLIGFAIERLTGRRLDQAIAERVTGPLGLRSVGFGPLPCANVAPTEFYAHHGRRMCGEVHDENAFAFGGIAGHAGLFGTASDVAAFGEALRRALNGAADGILQPRTLSEMTTVQAQDGEIRRGIGFALRSPNPQAMSYALSERAFGHLGFTGTSLWIDPARDLVFVCLTNHIYYGRVGEDTMTPFRAALSRAVAEATQLTDRPADIRQAHK